MNPDAQANIHDGQTLVFNTALTVELALLAHGPELGRKKARQFAKKDDAEGYFAPHLNKPVLLPSAGDKMAQALSIVKLIGKAAGEEAYRQDYDDEYEILFRAFRDGLTSAEPPKRSADGTLADLFRECGKHSDLIISAALPSDFEETATRDGAASLIDMIVDAFADGITEALA
jgi:hypothetical protein